MKKILYLLMISTLLTVTACNDWLDVSPRMEVKQDDQYSSEEGFRSALVGAYIKLASEDLYGRNTSYYVPDILARCWALKSSAGSFPKQTAFETWNFKQKDTEAMIAQIWKDYYFVIVHLNNILDNIDLHDVGMSSDCYNLIKGEVYGLRAFLHLEVLRLFGPMPQKAGESDKAIPYVTKMTKQVGSLLSKNWGEVIEAIKSDIEMSKEYLAKSDPILYATNPQLNNVFGHTFDGNEPPDDWFFYRQQRFNYYAALGTEARFYHWIGEKEKAVDAAREVIESGKFRLTTNADFVGTQLDYLIPVIMQSEHLFGLHNQKLQTIIIEYFTSSTPLLTQTRARVNTAFENNSSDTRLGTSRYWEDVVHPTGTVTHFRKFGGNQALMSNDLIPMLRLAEMYLIMIEDLPFGESRSYLSEYVNARNLPESVNNETEAQLLGRLEKEWRKEFFGEGQLFHFYKLHGYTRYTWPSTYNLPSEMVIPMPESQTVWDDGIIVMD